MKREDIEKLLGGYATGTLSEAERRALFEAALGDQELFDALMHEQALKDVLDDPRCRRQIVAALEATPQPFFARVSGWMRRPRAWALAGSCAALVLLASVVIRMAIPGFRKTEFELASQKAPASVAAPPAAPQDREVRQQAPPPVPRPARKAEFAPPRKAARPEPGVPPPPALEAESKALPAPQALAEARMPAAPPPPVVRAQAGSVASGGIGGVPPTPAPALTARDLYYRSPAPAESADVTASALVASERAKTRRADSADRKAAAEAPAPPEPPPPPSRVHPVFTASMVSPGGLGLRYTLLQRGVAVNPDAPLAAGGPVRLSVESNENAYVTVLGSRGVLYAGRAEAMKRQTVDIGAGETKLSIILTRQPDRGAAESLLNRTRAAPGARPLMTYKTGDDVYVVNPGTEAGARVLVELNLTYR